MSYPTLLISGKYLLPTSSQSSLLSDHGIAVTGDTITEIAPYEELHKRYPKAERLHTPFGLIMPGLVNTHTHAAMSCFRGIADDLPLMTWLQEHIFPAETKLTPDIVYKATLLSIAEMIKSGTTSFNDMYLFAKEVAAAADSAGIRAWIGEVLYDFPSPSYGELENGFNYVHEMFTQYRNNPLISITVDPHSVYTCAPDLLCKTAQIAEDLDLNLHIHLSENVPEVDTCRERYHRTPVQHLENLGVLSKRVIAAHCVVLDPHDIELLAEQNVNVSHCLESNMKLASGSAPVVELMQSGINVSIGTDGSASNNDVDMFGEISTVAKVHKGINLDPTVMNAETTLGCATIGGANALSASDTTGSIEVGKKCDCIVLDMDQPHLTPCYNVVSHLVYAARGSDVVHSVINGRVVMKNRKLQTIDEEKLLAEMRSLAGKICP
ncbi:amidohydrolase family protein [Desulfopila sp. IMCC35008]|uniref:amidohydrolase family protein n=1 Tax=Desulfopila sp. IMCC35008 TaxID=2653858 RepID=UPI0013CFEB43|nr:amidohydrolase family protein [Desulfopila sp. IMCC35008]